MGAGQECRPGDQGMMGGRRTQSSDCYGRALDRFFTFRAGARPRYCNGLEFCAARLHVFASLWTATMHILLSGIAEVMGWFSARWLARPNC